MDKNSKIKYHKVNKLKKLIQNNDTVEVTFEARELSKKYKVYNLFIKTIVYKDNGVELTLEGKII